MYISWSLSVHTDFRRQDVNLVDLKAKGSQLLALVDVLGHFCDVIVS